VATLRRALDRVREIRAAEPGRATPVVVEVADGRHELAATLVITPEDSGTEASPTVIRAAAGARPVISGGRAVHGWQAADVDGRPRWSVELADGWNPMPSPARASRMLRTPPIETIEDLERRIGDLGAASEKAGREIPPEVIFTPIGYDLFSGSFPDAAKFVDDIAAYSAIGVSTLTINLPGDTRAQWIESVEWLGGEVIANIDA
jgi:hypothetical protein